MQDSGNITATITDDKGEVRTVERTVSGAGSRSYYSALAESLLVLQTTVNDILTELVEESKTPNCSGDTVVATLTKGRGSQEPSSKKMRKEISM